MPPRRNVISNAEMERIIAQRIEEALTADRLTRSGESGANGGRNGGRSGEEGTNTRLCTYKDFLSCKPQNFAGTEGAVGLIRWIEKLESVFGICNCPEDSKVKFATCTLIDDALTWWNTYAKSVGITIAFQLPWKELTQMMSDEYCPSHEIQKLEEELWHLKVKGNDIANYTSRFHQLAHLCPHLISTEKKKIERYIHGLPASVQGDVTSSKPGTLQSAISMAHTLLAQIAQRQGTSEVNSTTRNNNGKRKWNNGNPGQQNEAEPIQVYATESNGNSGYKGFQPHCNKCNRHHTGQCGAPCANCKRFGHLTKDCRITAPINNQVGNTAANPRAPRACYECGDVGHLRNTCPKLMRQDTGPTNGGVYMITAGENDQNVV